MVTYRISAAALGFAALSTAQISNQHGGIVTCQGREFPTWDACDDLFNHLVSTPYRSPNPGWCDYWSEGGDVNCVVRLCWPSTASEHAAVFSSDINRAYQHIKGQCDPVNAGGNQDWFMDENPEEHAWDITIRNDPDFDGTSSALSRRSDEFNATQLLEELSDKSEVLDNGLHHFEISLENNELFEEAEQAFNERHEKSQKKRHADSQQKRDDEDKFVLISQSFAVVKEDERSPAGPLLASGAEYTWETSEGQSVGTSVTTGVSAGFWEVFTASVEVSVEEEYSVEYSESYTFNSGNCPSRGQNYFYPLFDKYHGFLESNPGENFDVWVPRGGDNIESPTLEYFIDIECLG